MVQEIKSASGTVKLEMSENVKFVIFVPGKVIL